MTPETKCDDVRPRYDYDDDDGLGRRKKWRRRGRDPDELVRLPDQDEVSQEDAWIR